jgi:hypothetical protein
MSHTTSQPCEHFFEHISPSATETKMRTNRYLQHEEMGTNHCGGEGVEVAGAVEHGGARTRLSFHEHLPEYGVSVTIAPSIPE